MDIAKLERAPKGMGRFVVSFPNTSAPMSFVAPTGHELSLGHIQRMVGGNIEWVISPMDLNPQLSIFCYEEARIFGKPLNRTMTEFLEPVYGYSQVGTFVIGSDTPNGRTVPLSHHSCVALERELGSINWTDHAMTAWDITSKVLSP